MKPHLSWMNFVLLTLAVSAVNFVSADETDGDGAVVTYNVHIKPILRQYCLKCHGDDRQEADLNLQQYGAVLRGGSGGKVVEPGRAGQSLLLKAITNPDPDARMPPNSPPLPDDRIAMIRKWIETGLRETSESRSMVRNRDLELALSATDDQRPVGEPAMPAENLSLVPAVDVLRPFPILAIDSSPWAPLLAVSALQQIRLVHAESKQEIARLAYPDGEPHVLRFSRNGEILMVAGGRPVEQGSVVLFDVRSGRRIAEVGDEVDEVLAADLSSDRQRIALGGSGQLVKVYSTTSSELLCRIDKHTDWITCVAFSPDGSRLATADRAGGIHLWDALTGGILLNLAEHKAAIRALDWRSDGRMLASASEDGSVIWWDVTDGFPAISQPNAHPPQRPPGTFGNIPGGILACRFSRDGRLATAGRDRVLRIWDASGTQQRSFGIESGIPISLAWTADNSHVVVGDSSGQISFHAVGDHNK
ncbi:MAG: c-type cytochrome domain-containing protein [Planctomycetaceae bacterium]